MRLCFWRESGGVSCTVKDLQTVDASAKLSTDGREGKKPPQNSCWSIRQPTEELHRPAMLYRTALFRNTDILGGHDCLEDKFQLAEPSPVHGEVKKPPPKAHLMLLQAGGLSGPVQS